MSALTTTPGPGRLPALATVEPKSRTVERPRNGATPTPRKTASSRHARSERRFARAPGPVELCAARNFFLRPWCVQRYCEESRFKNNAACAAPRHEARGF